MRTKITKTIGITISVIVVATLALVINPTARDEIHWLWANHVNETASYESYVKSWPAGRHADEAKLRYEGHEWADAVTINIEQGYEWYVLHHPDGMHVAEAKDKIETEHWKVAEKTNTEQGYWGYIRLHVGGKHVVESMDRIDIQQWKETAATNTEQGYERYILSHADGKHVVEAKDKIETLHWKVAAAYNTEVGYERYLRLHADGKHVVEAKDKIKEAKDKIEPLHWTEAIITNTDQGYERYILLHAGGKHEAEAKDMIESQHWKEAAATNTEQGYERYVRLHADGKHVVEAKDSIEFLELEMAVANKSPSLLVNFTNKYPDNNLVKTAQGKPITLEMTAWEKCRRWDAIDLYKNYISNYPDGKQVKEARARIQILQFNSAFRRSVKFTDEQVRTYINMLDDETCSTLVRNPLEYYVIENDKQGRMTKKKVIVGKSSVKKACALKLDAGNLSITAIYVLTNSGASINRPLFLEKWKPTITHNGLAGPRLEIKLPTLLCQDFEDFLNAFSIVYGDMHSTTGELWGCVIPDLLIGCDESGSQYPHMGHQFQITQQKDKLVFKVDGVAGLPPAAINTYKQALALKTYLKMTSEE